MSRFIERITYVSVPLSLIGFAANQWLPTVSWWAKVPWGLILAISVLLSAWVFAVEAERRGTPANRWWQAQVRRIRPSLWLEFDPVEPLIQERPDGKSWQFATRVRTSRRAFRNVIPFITSIRRWERDDAGAYKWGKELASGMPLQLGWPGALYTGIDISGEELLILFHYELDENGWLGKFFVDKKRIPAFAESRIMSPCKYKITVEFRSANHNRTFPQTMILDWFGDMRGVHLELL